MVDARGRYGMDGGLSPEGLVLGQDMADSRRLVRKGGVSLEEVVRLVSPWQVELPFFSD